MPRGQMSAETRQRVLELAWEARRKNRMARATRKETGTPGLRTEKSFYAEDKEVWLQAAKVECVRLPTDWSEPCTTTRMHAFLTKAGIPKAQYTAWWGMNIKQTIEANPEWPLRAWAGIVVEHLPAILEA